MKQMNRRELLKGLIVASNGGFAVSDYVFTEDDVRRRLYRASQLRALSPNEIRRLELEGITSSRTEAT